MSSRTSLNPSHLPPALTPDLAELIGIHMGDGNIYMRKGTYKITYAFHSSALQYQRHVQALFYSIFQQVLTKQTCKGKNAASLNIYSKYLCEYFVSTLQLPSGKKESLRIPYVIMADTVLLRRVLKGLFDTDGCITSQVDGKYAYLLVKFTTKHKEFADDIKDALKLLGIMSYICVKYWRDKPGYDIVIRRKPSICAFFSLIDPEKSLPSAHR